MSQWLPKMSAKLAKKEPGHLAQIQSENSEREFPKHNLYASGEMLYSKFSQHNDQTRVDARVHSFGLDHKQLGATIRSHYFNFTNYLHFVTMMFKMYKTKNHFLKLILTTLVTLVQAHVCSRIHISHIIALICIELLPLIFY